MVIKRIIYIIPLLSIVNSVYLAFIYLEAFMLEKYDKELVSNFSLILFSTLFVITTTITISHFTNRNKKIILNFRYYLTRILCGPIFSFFFLLFIYDSLKFDNSRLLVLGFSVSIEILSIAFAIGKHKENALLKLFGVVFLWVFVGTVCFSITGIFEQYLGYEELKDSDIRLVFTAIFFHLFNACFLFYSYLPKGMTEKAF